MTLFEALTGGAFDDLNWQHSGEFDQNFSKKSNPGGLPGGGAWAVLGLTGTLMEVDESDEYLKIVCAPQLLKFFNISNQIHSMYQLMQLQYTSYLTWTTFVKYGCPGLQLTGVRGTVRVHHAPRGASWQVDYLVSGCSNPTSLYRFLLTTSHPSRQISANAVFPLSIKTHPLLRNE